MITFLTALVVWAGTGMITAAILSRHGHPFGVYALMGLAFGPFVLLIWSEGARGQRTRTLAVEKKSNIDDTAPQPDGWIDVLVGLDGSDASIESVDHVLSTLGRALGRVRLTSAVDHEIGNAPDAFETDDHRAAYLHEAAKSLGMNAAEITLVSGQPDRALRDHARENDFDLLIVAHRRNPILSGLRGSTVGRLARTAEIPVLIGPAV